MSDFGAFVRLGFAHITTLDAVDHILFLVALAAIYTVRDWKDILWVVSAFTIGHSVTLALAVTGVLSLPTNVIEFLIPLTIVAVCAENIVVRERKAAGRGQKWRPVLAAVFGLVHGAGFANYLHSVFADRIAIPLVGFNAGIEIGQIVVLSVIFAGLYLIDRAIAVSRLAPASWQLVRLRASAISVLVMVVAARWAVLRSPW